LDERVEEERALDVWALDARVLDAWAVLVLRLVRPTLLVRRRVEC
jgi:hypothetical protein